MNSAIRKHLLMISTIFFNLFRRNNKQTKKKAYKKIITYFFKWTIIKF